MQRHFLQHGELCADLACLDPRNFPMIKAKGLPPNALQDISKCLLPFDEDVTVENLQSQLSVRATHWDTLKKSPLSEYKVRLCQPVVSEMEEDGSQMEMEQQEVDLVSKRCATCKNCALYCFLLLQQLSIFTHAYHTIGLAYKFLLTLSCTQVACERSSSILKEQTVTGQFGGPHADGD